MQAYEKSAADLKKGIFSREPDDLTTRLEDEDLLKMDLDEAIYMLTDEEDEQPEEIKEREKRAGSGSSNGKLVIENADEMN